MSFLDSARTRRSVRTFDGNGVDEKVLSELKTFAESITNPYGINITFKFLDAKEHKLSSPVLSGEKCYVSGVTKMEPHVEEAYGYSFQKLLMKAHDLGLGTVWIGGTMPREKFEEASELKDGEIMPCVSPLGVAAGKMGIKEGLMRTGLKADKRFKFEDLFFAGNFSKPLSESEAEKCGLKDALTAVQLAPSAVNKQPWRVVIDGNKAHFYEKHDKGFTAAGYDLQKIDVGIALYNFEAELTSEGKAPELSIEVPAILVPENIEYVATYRF